MRKILVAMAIAALTVSCSALDSDETPYKGWDNKQLPPNVAVDLYAGTYSGTITMVKADSACTTDVDGESISLNIIQNGSTVSVKFDDGVVVNGVLEGQNVIVEKAGADRRIYYLNFGDNSIDGSYEIFDKKVSDGYGEPCADFKMSLTKK